MTSAGPVRIGVIGGTGLYDMPLDNRREVEVSTPFGDPSDVLTIGEIEGTPGRLSAPVMGGGTGSSPRRSRRARTSTR